MGIETEGGELPQSGALAGLLHEAGKIDGEVVAASPEAIMADEAASEAITLADENRQGVVMILELALPIIGEMYPSLQTIYTPDAQRAIAGTMGPLLAKYGVNLKDMGGRYQEEIAAAFVCGPIAWATVKGIKADIAARAGAPKAVEHQSAAAVPTGGKLRPGDYGYVEAQTEEVPGLAGA
jgi:hypothetical protein